MMIKNIKAEIEASINVKKSLINNDLLLEKVLDLSEKCISSLRAGGKLLLNNQP